MLPFVRRPFCFAAVLLLTLVGAARAASPPKVTIDSAFGGGLIRGRWQPLLVTLTNGADGQGIAPGEVQVSVEDPSQAGRVLSTASRAVSLPGGPGVAQAIVYVRVPDGVVPNVFVQVADRASGETVTRKRMDKLPIAPDQLTVVAASDLPDALAYLRAETLGVIVENGVLRPYDDPTGGVAGRFRSAFQPADKVVPLNPITLPDRAAGYDGVAAVYLGDIAPDTLSNAQVAALQTWTAGGGLLVCGGPRLQTDERFRAWLPVRWGAPGAPSAPDPLAARYRTARSQITYAPLAPVPGRGARPFLGARAGNVALAAPVGRGTLVALGFDAATTAFADWPGRLDLWRDVAARGVTTPAVTAAIDAPTLRWNNGGSATFSQSVLRAPGLSAPGFGAIGAFLLAYLVLLVPVNYAVLKRLDRRELTWLTVPVLVLLFSASAYGFGYRLKGGQIRMNVASLVEMASGSGQATVLSSVGLFSPRRTSYDVSLAGDEALFFDPSTSRFGGSGEQNDYAPLSVSQEPGESRARSTDVSMWAMRVLNARATTRLGRGVDARLHVQRNDLAGTLTNRTGRDLDDVTVLIAGQRQTVGVLRNGESKPVRLTGAARFLGARARNPFPDDWQNFWNGVRLGSVPEARRTREGIRRMVRAAVHAGMTNRAQMPGVKKAGNGNEAAPILVTAWSYDPLLPVRVDGRPVPDGDNVSLLIVHVPVAKR